MLIRWGCTRKGQFKRPRKGTAFQNKTERNEKISITELTDKNLTSEVVLGVRTGVPKLFPAKAPQTALASRWGPLTQTNRLCWQSTRAWNCNQIDKFISGSHKSASHMFSASDKQSDSVSFSWLQNYFAWLCQQRSWCTKEKSSDPISDQPQLALLCVLHCSWTNQLM